MRKGEGATSQAKKVRGRRDAGRVSEKFDSLKIGYWRKNIFLQ